VCYFFDCCRTNTYCLPNTHWYQPQQVLGDIRRVVSLEKAATLLELPSLGSAIDSGGSSSSRGASTSASAGAGAGAGPGIAYREEHEDSDLQFAQLLAQEDSYADLGMYDDSTSGGAGPGSDYGTDLDLDDPSLSANQKRKLLKRKQQLAEMQEQQRQQVGALMQQQQAASARHVGGNSNAFASTDGSYSASGRSGGGGGGSGNSTDWLLELGFSEDYLLQERALGLEKMKPKAIEDKWLDGLAPEGTTEVREGRRALPVGTTREVNVKDSYEEVFIPATKNRPMMTEDQHIQISSLVPWAQLAFPGMERLNTIQSTVFNTGMYVRK